MSGDRAAVIRDLHLADPPVRALTRQDRRDLALACIGGATILALIVWAVIR